MNKNEQKVADALLKKIETANVNEVVQFAAAYRELTQGALCRKQAENTPAK